MTFVETGAFRVKTPITGNIGRVYDNDHNTHCENKDIESIRFAWYYFHFRHKTLHIQMENSPVIGKCFKRSRLECHIQKRCLSRSLGQNHFNNITTEEQNYRLLQEHIKGEHG